MKRAPPAYIIGNDRDVYPWDNPHEYWMVFEDECPDMATYTSYRIQIKKTIYHPDGRRDKHVVKEETVTEPRGTQRFLMIQVLTKLSGDDDLLKYIANTLWWEHEVNVERKPGIYAEFFPEQYEQFIRSMMWNRERRTQEVLNE